ncbi:hypothetical protein EH802P2_00092 [Enterococcus phage EH802P2]|nr:hypothetical protein EH802P1_00007 [Enterococcus phage EH802P1]WAX16197.1 hypothetical protein EH802P2_00092 [Enterococcus phage EH802P2]
MTFEIIADLFMVVLLVGLVIMLLIISKRDH